MQALQDRAWQAGNRQRLAEQTARLCGVLDAHDLGPTGGCNLFQWVVTPLATQLYDRLAQQGVLVREFERPASLRFGLPANDRELVRLQKALGRACRELGT
jgi:cobalamin biosynthetic protein CobC